MSTIQNISVQATKEYDSDACHHATTVIVSPNIDGASISLYLTPEMAMRLMADLEKCAQEALSNRAEYKRAQLKDAA